MKQILVLCTGNSCRSVMAEALLNHYGQGRVKAVSAGSKPTGFVHPITLEVLKNAHITAEGFSSKSWDNFKDETFDAVITVCGNAKNETCPVFLGAPVKAHWGVDDPARVDGPPARVLPEFERVFAILEKRVKAFLEKPVETMDNAALKAALEAAATLS